MNQTPPWSGGSTVIAPARPARVRAEDGLLLDAVRVAAVYVFVTTPPQPRRSAGNPAHGETKDAAMTAPVVQDPKNKAKQEAEAAELQDRIINLQDQERQVQREMAEHRQEQERELRQAERESTDRLRQQQTDALDTLSRQARDGARQVEQATRALAQGTAVSAASLLPPVLTQPALLVDLAFNTAVAVLSFQRDFWTELLTTGRPVSAGAR